MNKKSAIVAMTLGVVLVVGAFAMMVKADSPTESSALLLPQMGMMRSSQNIRMVNLEPVRVEIAAGSALPITLRYHEECYMPKGTPFVSVGIDGDQVLVRSRYTGPIYLYDEGLPRCNDQALFWVHKQQFILAAGEYRRAQETATAQQSAEERERAIVRRLLDEELAAKPAK